MAQLHRTFSRNLTWKISTCQFQLCNPQPQAAPQPLVPKSQNMTGHQKTQTLRVKRWQSIRGTGSAPSTERAPCPQTRISPQSLPLPPSSPAALPAPPGRTGCSHNRWSVLPWGLLNQGEGEERTHEQGRGWKAETQTVVLISDRLPRPGRGEGGKALP